MNAVGDHTRREGGEGRPLLVPLASGPQGQGQAFRGRVSVKLGSIGTLVFHPGVVGVLQFSCWADPCDGSVKAIFPIDDPVGWLVRGLTTFDCLCAIGPGLAENYRGFVFSGVEAGHIQHCHGWVYLLVLKVPLTFTLVSDVVTKADLPSVRSPTIGHQEGDVVLHRWRIVVGRVSAVSDNTRGERGVGSPHSPMFTNKKFTKM